MSVSVGIDLVTVEQVQESMARHGSRYLPRIYKEQELADCAGDPARLAARAAAPAARLPRPAGEGTQPRARGGTGRAGSRTHEPQHVAVSGRAESGLFASRGILR